MSAVKQEGLWVKSLLYISFSVLGSSVIARVFHTGNYQKAFVTVTMDSRSCDQLEGCELHIRGPVGYVCAWI